MKERLAMGIGRCGKQVLGVFLIFALMFGALFSVNLMAQAKTDGSAAVDTLFVYAKSNDGDVLLKAIPYDEIVALEHGHEAGGTNYYYSYTDSVSPTVYCEARGITLPELFDYVKQETSVAGAASLTFAGSDRMYFMATDASSYNSRYYTYDELYGTDRYYFPGMYKYRDNYDFETANNGNADDNYHSDCGGTICGDSTCKYFTDAKNDVFSTGVPMEAILATNSYAGRTAALSSFISANDGEITGCLADELDELSALRLTIPQSEKVMRTGERTANQNFKWIYNILFDTADGAPIVSEGVTVAPTATAIFDEAADTLTITLASATEGASIYHSFEDASLTGQTGTPQYLYEGPLVFALNGANPPDSVNFYALAVKEGYSNASFGSASKITCNPVAAGTSDPEPVLAYVLQADKDALQVGDTVQLTATLHSDQDSYNLYGAQYALTFDNDAFSNLAVTPDANWQYGERVDEGKTTVTFTLLDREGIIAGAVSDIATISATAARTGNYTISCTAAVATNAAAVELTSVSPAAPLEFTIATGTQQPPADDTAVWDGRVNVAWYNETDSDFYISTPAQLAGLAAIVNGRTDVAVTPDMITGNAGYIRKANADEGFTYGVDSFKGKKIYLTADLDMGGVFDGSSWSGPNFTPVGGQWLTDTNDASTLLGASFNGTFDGQGHKIYNIYCERSTDTSGYGNGQSVGLIGRLGVHDDDPADMRADNPTVCDVSVDGYISGRRSVGGIVGKIGRTNDGVTIENCTNFATVKATDSKGTGGIVGAAWNSGVINNCYNAGDVSNSGNYVTGGIVGDNEITVRNSYNVGRVTSGGDTRGLALGTSGGGSFINCYYLAGSGQTPGGVYSPQETDTFYELSAEDMKADDFVLALNVNGNSYNADSEGINNGYPVLIWQGGRPVGTTPADDTAVWDGRVNVAWYNETDSDFYISTPAQLAGLAAIVNGRTDVAVTPDMITGNAGYIRKANADEGFTYGVDSFKGKKIYLTADLDMGGVFDGSNWSGPNFTPVGGQWLTDTNDASTLLGASFNGTFDGQGHKIYNIYCERSTDTSGYGNGQSVGLIGRLGVHDSDPVDMRADEPAVRNVSVDGYISGLRSVGGIVGKIGKTNDGVIIENCANFATVKSANSKGTGGIVGAAWNGGEIKNCYNAGDVSNSGNYVTGGIVGDNEITVRNSYNVGRVTSGGDTRGLALGTSGGGSFINCYYLAGSGQTPGGVYSPQETDTFYELSAEDMKADDFVLALNVNGNSYNADSEGINNGYPVLIWQGGRAVGTTVQLTTDNTGFEGLAAEYIYSGGSISPSFVLYYTGGTEPVELVKGTDYTVTYSDNEDIGVGTITIQGAGTYQGSLVLTFNIVEEGTPTPEGPKSSLTAVGKAYIDESNRSLSYTIMLDDVQNGGIFKIGANFDAQRLDYVDYTLNLPTGTFAVAGGFTGGGYYDEASGEFRSRVYLTASGTDNLFQTSEPTALLTINFKINDSITIEDLELGTITVEGILNSVEVTWYDGENNNAYTVSSTVVEGVAQTELLKIDLKYDANGDGQFNEADILLVIVNYFMITKDDNEWKAAQVFDVHENGVINTADIIALFNMLDW